MPALTYCKKCFFFIGVIFIATLACSSLAPQPPAATHISPTLTLTNTPSETPTATIAADTPQPMSTETPIPEPNAKAIGLGYDHACALTPEGGVKCWGLNKFGGLGNGKTSDSKKPVDVVGLSHGVKAIAVGGLHTCALTSEGGVKCWGYNENGQLGDGTITNSSTPVEVIGLSSGVKAISSGARHTCAILSSGGLKCWGDNQFGALGNGSTQGSNVPVDVAGLSSGVKAVTAGSLSTCAITEDGGVKCWGSNQEGELGNGTQNDQIRPVDVIGLQGGIVSVAMGAGGSTCTLDSNGRVMCWGGNDYGQLGKKASEASATPTEVANLPDGVEVISLGWYHSCVMTREGSIQCWGRNSDGELGNGKNANSSTPVDVVGLTSGAQFLCAAYTHTCAINSAGLAVCWGSNEYGSLGDGTENSRSKPVEVEEL
jgi:alpha-tubulin suppressor-like RCC1 family protein